jgi:molybdopterin synthase catalytic subunit
LELPSGATARQAAEALVARYPQLGWLLQIARPAINLEYASWECELPPDAEVAFIPPVSGGKPTMLSDEALDLALLIREVERPEAGGLTTFSGVVRNNSRGRRVLYLEYDGYRPMAEKKLQELAEEVEQRWECRIAIRHRLGRLEIGEASVMIAVSSAHRATAFEACRHAIDTLKVTVPIWKKEVWEGGEVWIEGEGESRIIPPPAAALSPPPPTPRSR